MNELGFINRGRFTSVTSTTMTGSNGFPSKKIGVGAPTKVMVRPPVQEDVSQSALIQKRCDYLETQEKKLSESVTTTTSTLRESFDRRSEDLFRECQWIYGRTTRHLKGVSCSEKVQTSLERYRSCRSMDEMGVKEICPAGRWVHLTYPMERVDISPTHHQVLMRCKTVDPSTGQISICWAILSESKDGKTTKFVKDFSMVPH